MSFQNRNLQIDEARSLTKPVIGRGENPGHLENRPKSVLDVGDDRNYYGPVVHDSRVDDRH